MEGSIRYVTNFWDSLGASLGADLSRFPAAILIAVGCYLIYKSVLKILDTFINKTHLEKNIIKIITMMVKIFILFIAIMMVASALGINTSSLIAAFSIFGLAISLAVQNLMSNLANAISIYVNRPFVIDDYVSIDGIEGTVLDISFMLTKLKTAKNEIIYITNSKVGSSIIINYTQTSQRRIEHILDASYDAPIDDVKYAIREAIMEEPLVDKDQEIYIAVANYSTSSIQYRVRVYCNNTDFIKCRDSLIERYKKVFDAHGISIPYTTLSVNLVDKNV